MKKHLFKKNLLKSGINSESLWHLKYNLPLLSTFSVQRDRKSPSAECSQSTVLLLPPLPVKVVVYPREEAVRNSHLFPPPTHDAAVKLYESAAKKSGAPRVHPVPTNREEPPCQEQHANNTGVLITLSSACSWFGVSIPRKANWEQVTAYTTSLLIKQECNWEKQATVTTSSSGAVAQRFFQEKDKGHMNRPVSPKEMTLFKLVVEKFNLRVFSKTITVLMANKSEESGSFVTAINKTIRKIVYQREPGKNIAKNSSLGVMGSQETPKTHVKNHPCKWTQI